ncbi:hypothetical protein NE237_023452 [Protea cynaroides]|uniref:BHLH domain-containing protein n=1 Tax=Protea cynaroides TaxID=273540 RepID=A0A9Q0K6M2_9MAGN|nr:hypothetical protein NE237_023452 [Protea cynaroides]
MAEEGGCGDLRRENHSQQAISNSISSGGSDDKSGKKPPESSSTPTIMVDQKIAGKEDSENGKNDESEGNECRGGRRDSDRDHETHIWTERERRKKMRTMFTNLHALLPHLPAKADKSTIVDEAVSYIKTLQQTLQKLQKKKLAMLWGSSSTEFGSSSSTVEPRELFLADQGYSNSSKNLAITTVNSSSNSLGFPRFPISLQTWSSPNVVLNVSGNDAQICVCTPKKPGLLTTALYVLEKHKLEVVTANISSDNYRSMYMIHARVNGAADQFSEALSAEEIFKQAVGEMIFWLSS